MRKSQGYFYYEQHKEQIEYFFFDDDIASYYLGVIQDFKHSGITVSVIILNSDEFPERHNFKTEKLFSPSKFENKKENKGYWF